MIIIVAVDDRNGIMFNGRRQSQDRVLRQRILDLTVSSRLWTNHYTQKQFTETNVPQLNIDENFLREAAPGEYCFVEDVSVAPYEKRVEKIILFKWNRKYPGDFYFDIDVKGKEWHLKSTEEFQGSSMIKSRWRSTPDEKAPPTNACPVMCSRL